MSDTAMLKRILVLLGETSASASARQYAFRLTKSTEAAVAGLAGIDLTYIEASMPGAIGASAYKVRLEEQLKKQAEDIRHRLHEAFELECRDRNVPFEWLSFEGDPIEALYLATEVRDLVITGHDTAFCGSVHEQLSEVLAKLLLITPRPVIVCPDDISATDDVLIAYDGSVPAMRAVQLFTLLGVGQGKRIHVTSIDASQELAARRTGGAAGYLRSHGYEVETNPIASRVHPAEVLNIEIADRKIGTLVIGAYGHRGFREFLFGSTTSTLVESPPCALFVYH
jgi:nucleotide-binding universal stress UspA family protein